MADQAGERIEVDPRREFRARRAAIENGDLSALGVGDPPPSLLGPPVASSPRWDPKLVSASPDPLEGFDPYKEALRVRVRPGQEPNRRARVRVYHLADDDADPCWAFTITRAAFDRLGSEGLLDSDGATYPDGRAVVPTGVDPLLSVSVRCGTCGTHSVECLQIIFYQDST